jgi:hypothetical protein
LQNVFLPLFSPFPGKRTSPKSVSFSKSVKGNFN